MSGKPGFFLFSTDFAGSSEMTDEELGKIFRAVLEFEKNGTEILTDRFLKMIFAPIKKNLEKDQEKYEKICEKNAKNGKKGGRPKSEKTQSVFSKPKKTQKSLTQTQTQTQTQKEKTISKEITAPPSSPENFEEKKSFGNPQISQTLEFLKKSVGLDEFKESSRMQRNFGKHFVNLLKKIGRDEFLRRMNEILEDDFRAKNCNSLKYFYGEMKSAIHSPSVIPKSGKTAETTPLCSFDD